jgi:hypothetical protein
VKVTGYPNEPPGLAVLEVDNVRYLVFELESGDLGQTLGWYYGYPGCCVEAFEAKPFGVPPSSRTHPVSGHVLCRRCETGPLAPLPPRPAETFGLCRRYRGGSSVGQPSSHGESARTRWLPRPLEPPPGQLVLELGAVLVHAFDDDAYERALKREEQEAAELLLAGESGTPPEAPTA